MARGHSRMVFYLLGLALAVSGCDDTPTPDAGPDSSTDGDADSDGDGDVDADGDGDGDADVPWTLVIEAETFEVNEYWAVCPGTDCEDDQSAAASGDGHIMTREGHVAGAQGAVRHTVALPGAGEYSLWALSVRAGEGREWGIALGENEATVVGTSIAGSWEQASSAVIDGSEIELVIHDASPNEYWAYPDALLITDDPTYDPNNTDPPPDPPELERPEFDPPRSCDEIAHDYPCVEVADCGQLSESGRYYLLSNDISTNGSCLLTTDDVVIDLNSHTLTFNDGYGGAIQNGGFEESSIGDSGTSVAGWDLSGASGAEVVDRWTMPLVGDRSLRVTAGGVIVSSWVELPVADRTYRGSVVQRGPGEPVTVTVERETDGGTETVCTRNVVDSLGGGKAAFCNFHGQPSGRYRLRITSPRDQYYDDAAIVPARTAGIGAVRYYTTYEDRPDHVCNLDDGSCHMPDSAGDGGPTVDGGTIEIRNGLISAGSRGMKTYGIYVNGAEVRLERVVVESTGVAAQALNAGTVDIHDSFFEVDMPWVIDRESISETAVHVGSGSVIEGSIFLGGQGCLSMSGADNVTLRSNWFINRATVTNHYAINVGGSDSITIEGNTFNCDSDDDEGCVTFSGSGILMYRSRNSSILGNTFYMVAAPCDAEYVDGTFTTNAIRLTDYNAAEGAENGVFGNVINDNTFDLRAASFPAMPDCDVYANGVFYSVGAGDNTFEGNTVESTTFDAAASSYAFYIGAANNGGIYRGNTLRSNDRVVWFSSAYGEAANARFIENTFERVDNPHYTPAEPTAAIRLGYCCGNRADGLVLRNNNYHGGYDADAFWYTSNQPAPYSFSMEWYVEVTVTDGDGSAVAGAQVSLSGDGETAEGETNGTGFVRLAATEYSQSGTNHREDTTIDRTEVTPHTLTVTASGLPTSTQTVSVTEPTSVAVTLE